MEIRFSEETSKTDEFQENRLQNYVVDQTQVVRKSLIHFF